MTVYNSFTENLDINTPEFNKVAGIFRFTIDLPQYSTDTIKLSLTDNKIVIKDSEGNRLNTYRIDTTLLNTEKIRAFIIDDVLNVEIPKYESN